MFLIESPQRLQRNHVVCLAILFSCQGTDIRERGARLGAPPIRVKQNVSTFGERILSDAELLIRGKNCRDFRTAGLRILLAASRRVNCAGTATTLSPPGLFRDRGFRHPKNFVPPRSRSQRLATPPYSGPPLHNSLCRLGLLIGSATIWDPRGTQHNHPHPGAIPRFRTAISAAAAKAATTTDAQ